MHLVIFTVESQFLEPRRESGKEDRVGAIGSARSWGEGLGGKIAMFIGLNARETTFGLVEKSRACLIGIPLYF